MIHYSFVTTWKFKDQPEAVGRILLDYERWPRWWSGMDTVKTLSLSKTGVHTIYMKVGYGPYKLRFTVIVTTERKEKVQLAASGDLVGDGSIELLNIDPVRIVIVWNVSTTKWWMNGVSIVVKPIFAFIHNLIMSRGGQSLAKEAKTMLISAESKLIA